MVQSYSKAVIINEFDEIKQLTHREKLIIKDLDLCINIATVMRVYCSLNLDKAVIYKSQDEKPRLLYVKG
jgi:hypothetical protein